MSKSVPLFNRLALIGVGLIGSSIARAAPALFPADPSPWSARLADIERRLGGRLGVMALDTGNGRRLSNRARERFRMCSTFKLLAAAAVLRRVDEGKEKLDRRVKFATSDLVVNSPITKERAGGEGMSVAEL